MGRVRQFDADEVLGKAMRLFWRKGYEATSLDDLLRETGLARQSLYNTFGGKHALFLAALRRYDADGDETMAASFAGDVPVREALRRFVTGVAHRAGERKRRGCFLVNSAVELSPSDPDTERIVVAQHLRMEKTIREALERGRRRGEISSKKNPRALARFLVVLLHGLNVATRAGADRATLDDAAKTALQALD